MAGAFYDRAKSCYYANESHCTCRPSHISCLIRRNNTIQMQVWRTIIYCIEVCLHSGTVLMKTRPLT